MGTSENCRTVLVVEPERELTNSLREWLNDEYEVLTAHSPEEAQELHDGHVSVTFIDRDFESGAINALLDRIYEQDFAGRVVSVSPVSDSGATHPDIDDHFQKSEILGEGREALDHLIKQAVYEEEIHEWLSLLSKKATLEKEMAAPELEESAEYDRLIDEIDELRERAGTTRDDIPGERFDAIFREIGRGTLDEDQLSFGEHSR